MTEKDGIESLSEFLRSLIAPHAAIRWLEAQPEQKLMWLEKWFDGLPVLAPYNRSILEEMKGRGLTLEQLASDLDTRLAQLYRKTADRLDMLQG
jgi:hypothetical protein